MKSFTLRPLNNEATLIKQKGNFLIFALTPFERNYL